MDFHSKSIVLEEYRLKEKEGFFRLTCANFKHPSTKPWVLVGNFHLPLGPLKGLHVVFPIYGGRDFFCTAVRGFWGFTEV